MSGRAFVIEVQTADKLWAGTDDTVEISMEGTVYGEKGRLEQKETGKLKLDGKMRNDHERGEKCKYVVDESPYEFEKILNLTVYKGGIDDWNLDYIEGIVSFLLTI